MPIELSMWRIDSKLTPIEQSRMNLENRLEDLLAEDISVASPDWMVIGRQVSTPGDRRIDLLCLDVFGNLVVLELKRHKTEREIIAQVLDYGSYVRTIKPDEIPRLFARFQESYFPKQPTKSLEEAFCEHFRTKGMPEELNAKHDLVIVASTLDAASERIVDYLAEEYDVHINAVFFQVFKDGDREYLTRAWYREQSGTDEGSPKSPKVSEKVDWNNEYYVNFAPSQHRNWNDAIKYGFVSAGNGVKFRDAMLRLEPGGRIWVNAPGYGYVGVGVIQAAAVPVNEFLVTNGNGREVPITEAPHLAENLAESVGDPDNVEYLARVNWNKTVPLEQAIRERGFFGNQNVVAEPRDPRWPYTVERLKQVFGVS